MKGHEHDEGCDGSLEMLAWLLCVVVFACFVGLWAVFA